jgi:hypothetical protein
VAEHGGDVGMAEGEPHRVGHPHERLPAPVPFVVRVGVLAERRGHRVDEEPVGQAQLRHGCSPSLDRQVDTLVYRVDTFVYPEARVKSAHETDP